MQTPLGILRPAAGRLLVLAFSLAACSPAAVTAETWSTFQNGGVLAIPQANLPTEWSPETGVAWQVPLAGYGQSSPVVEGGVIYVTSISGDMKQQLHVEAVDLTSGKQLWRLDAKNSTPQENTSYVSKAAPTPVCDDSGVIALFEGGNVVALTRAGKPRWQRDLVAEYGGITSRHGLGSSLEQDDQRVFGWIERQEAPYIAALSKQTGETVWKVDGLGATSWSSPRLVPVDGGMHLVCSASGKIAGFDPSDGKRLWEFDQISNNTTCTPIPVGEGRFLIGASDGRGQENSGQGAASNGLLAIAKQDNGSYSVDFVWRATKASCSFGSPIAAGGKAWIVNRAGVLFALDLKTGEELSTTRVGSGSIWATPLVTADHLYLFGYKGTTSVLSLADGAELAENRLWEAAAEPAEGQRGGPSLGGGHTLYAAVAASPYLVLRRGDMLYAVTGQKSETPQESAGTR